MKLERLPGKDLGTQGTLERNWAAGRERSGEPEAVRAEMPASPVFVKIPYRTVDAIHAVQHANIHQRDLRPRIRRTVLHTFRCRGTPAISLYALAFGQLCLLKVPPFLCHWPNEAGLDLTGLLREPIPDQRCQLI